MITFMRTKTTVTVVVNNKVHTFDNSSPNFNAVIAAIKNNDIPALEVLVDVKQAVQKFANGITLEGDRVFYNGREIHNSIVTRIADFMREGLPHEPLINFLGNLMQNPSKNSVDELYGFLEHGNMPITEDGCFMAYKGVRSDFKDIHSGQFDNSPGAVNEVPRNEVDDNRMNTCSYGFHVGTYEYANNFAQGGRVVLVKVNPRDAVSVPADHNAQKLRVCRYEVVVEMENRNVPLDQVQYGIDRRDNNFEDDFDNDDDSDYGAEDGNGCHCDCHNCRNGDCRCG